MTPHPSSSENLEERNRRGILFRRLANCPNCDSPKYASNDKPIRFVPPRRNRWAPI